VLEGATEVTAAVTGRLEKAVGIEVDDAVVIIRTGVRAGEDAKRWSGKRGSNIKSSEELTGTVELRVAGLRRPTPLAAMVELRTAAFDVEDACSGEDLRPSTRSRVEADLKLENIWDAAARACARRETSFRLQVHSPENKKRDLGLQI
jgi:hypothetical protein